MRTYIVKRGGKTHCIARCLVCNKDWQGQHTANINARRHTDKTGHRTSFEVAYAYTYGKLTK